MCMRKSRVTGIEYIASQAIIWSIPMYPKQFYKGTTFSDFIWSFLTPYMGAIPNPKMFFIFPVSCILVLIFPFFMIYFPKSEGQRSFPKSQIKSLTLYKFKEKGEYYLENLIWYILINAHAAKQTHAGHFMGRLHCRNFDIQSIHWCNLIINMDSSRGRSQLIWIYIIFRQKL